MVFDPHGRNTHDSLQKSLALCETLEQGLVELLYNQRLSKLNDLVRVTHTLSQTAQSNTTVANLAHRLETIFRSLEQKSEIGSELVEMVLQAYEYLRLLLIAQIKKDHSGMAEALAKAETVFTRLETQLDCRSDAASERSRTNSVNISAQSIASAEVEQILKRLEKILSHPGEQLIEELKYWSHRLLKLGTTLENSEFVAIARSTLDILETNSQSASFVGRIALEGFRSVQADSNSRVEETQAQLRTDTDSPPAEVVLEPATIFREENEVMYSVEQAQSFTETTQEKDREAVPELSLDLSFEGGIEPARRRTRNTFQVNDRDRAQKDVLDISAAALPRRLKIAEVFVWRAASTIFTLPYSSIEEQVTQRAEFVQFGKQRFMHWRQQVIQVYQLLKLLGQNWIPQVVASLNKLSEITSSSEFNGLLKSLDCMQAALNLNPRPLENRDNATILPSNDGGVANYQSVLMLVLRQGQQFLALESAIDCLVIEPELLVVPFSNSLVPWDYCDGCTILANGEQLPVINVAALLRQEIKML